MVDVLVIGAGIVGSWVARYLAERGRSVVVCDAATRPGDGITGRNSGVIHAGIYYPPDSAKARHCLRGRRLLLEFAARHDVPHEVCGKLSVTGHQTDETREAAAARLHQLYENAQASGAENLELLAHPGREYPGVPGELAIHSKGSGVVDPAAYHSAVRHFAEDAGAIFLPGRRFLEGAAGEARFRAPDGETETIVAGQVVNAAGLFSDDVARAFGLRDYEIRPNRGEYYRLRRPLPYRKLIYPLPATDSTALGVHYTFQPDGEAYAGPNSVWADHKEDYDISMAAAPFAESLARILDVYQPEDLTPGYSGLRPRLFQRGEALRDYLIAEEPAGVWHVLGIESPGLTAAASLAEEVAGRLG